MSTSYTTELIDRYKRTIGVESDYAAAQALGLRPNRISNYRTGISHADDKTAVMLATVLHLDPFETIARINLDRATKREDKAFWRKLASNAALVALALTFALEARADAYSTGRNPLETGRTPIETGRTPIEPPALCIMRSNATGRCGRAHRRLQASNARSTDTCRLRRQASVRGVVLRPRRDPISISVDGDLRREDQLAHGVLFLVGLDRLSSAFIRHRDAAAECGFSRR